MHNLDPVIKVNNLSKCYRIFNNPQDRFKQAFIDRFPLLKKIIRRELFKEYWALKNVSFEIYPGEAVGILGRNGAGKSTLLQMIAGTLNPTSGSVETLGRINAMLELGSGFNPEFSGLENVFYSAQILGLSQNEISNKFDQIAGFADIGNFINQPVKTYSSGMLMRLAFAVQAMMDPNILIVDEALSVGDVFFQSKCMLRIKKMMDDGVTILFVSHDIGSVRQLCNRALLIDSGKLKKIGPVASVSDEYVEYDLKGRDDLRGDLKEINSENGSELAKSLNLDYLQGSSEFASKASLKRYGNFDAEIINVVMEKNDLMTTQFEFNDQANLKLYLKTNKKLDNLNVAIKFRTLQGTEFGFFDTRIQNKMEMIYKDNEIYLFDWKISLPLMHGDYIVSCWVERPPLNESSDWIFVDIIQHAYEFRVSPRSNGMIAGLVSWDANLEIVSVTENLYK